MVDNTYILKIQFNNLLRCTIKVIYNVQVKGKKNRFDYIDKFNDASRYLDDIFTIDNPAFDKHIPDIYPRELPLNKANTSDKETSFLDLNIKVIGNNIEPAFTTNEMTLDFL